MDLTIVDTTRNTTEQISVPATVATERIIGRLLELWQLPRRGCDGQSLFYTLDYTDGGRAIGLDESLADAGVRDNDVLKLVVTSTNGSTRGAEASASLSSAVTGASSTPISTLVAPAVARQPHGDRRHGDVSRAAERTSRRQPALYVVVLAIVLVATAAGALFATGALSGGSRSEQKSVPAHELGGISPQVPTTPMVLTASAQRRAREIIMGVLTHYQTDYSTHNATALSGLFAGSVTRHGLAAGGCRVSHGRGAVVASYQSQFREGSGAYSMSNVQIQLDSIRQAHVYAHYRITPGGTGYVNFHFVEAVDGWKISEVDATCR